MKNSSSSITMKYKMKNLTIVVAERKKKTFKRQCSLKRRRTISG